MRSKWQSEEVAGSDPIDGDREKQKQQCHPVLIQQDNVQVLLTFFGGKKLWQQINKKRTNSTDQQDNME